jgi:hypothetical protein
MPKVIMDVKKLDTAIWSPLAEWMRYLSLLEAVRWDGVEADFLAYTAALYTIVEVGAGATITQDPQAGGVLKIVTTALEDDGTQYQLKGESFKLLTGKFAYFEAKFKVDDALQLDLLFGLCITDTTLIPGMDDGVYWQKDDGDANLDFHAIKNTTATDQTAVATLSPATWTRLGFYFDGYKNVIPYVNGVAYTSKQISTNIPDDEELTPSFAILTGEAAAKTLEMDYVFAVQAR